MGFEVVAEAPTDPEDPASRTPAEMLFGGVVLSPHAMRAALLERSGAVTELIAVTDVVD